MLQSEARYLAHGNATVVNRVAQLAGCWEEKKSVRASFWAIRGLKLRHVPFRLGSELRFRNTNMLWTNGSTPAF